MPSLATLIGAFVLMSQPVSDDPDARPVDPEFQQYLDSLPTCDDELRIVPVPALVAVLLNLERENGRPLTESEVLAVRDSAEAIVMTCEQHRAVIAGRGYLDIDPEEPWEEWRTIRRQFDLPD